MYVNCDCMLRCRLEGKGCGLQGCCQAFTGSITTAQPKETARMRLAWALVGVVALFPALCRAWVTPLSANQLLGRSRVAVHLRINSRATRCVKAQRGFLGCVAQADKADDVGETVMLLHVHLTRVVSPVCMFFVRVRKKMCSCVSVVSPSSLEVSTIAHSPCAQLLTNEQCEILELPYGTKIVGEMDEFMVERLTKRGTYEVATGCICEIRARAYVRALFFSHGLFRVRQGSTGLHDFR